MLLQLLISGFQLLISGLLLLGLLHQLLDLGLDLVEPLGQHRILALEELQARAEQELLVADKLGDARLALDMIQGRVPAETVVARAVRPNGMGALAI